MAPCESPFVNMSRALLVSIVAVESEVAMEVALTVVVVTSVVVEVATVGAAIAHCQREGVLATCRTR